MVGIVKINVDAALNPVMEFIGVGKVARNDRGVVRRALSRRIFGSFSPHVGECLAVREGVWMALSLGVSQWSIESDAINVVQSVLNANDQSMEANIIDDICNSLNQAGSGSICYGSRKGNSVVNFLANLVLSSSVSSLWFDVLPRCLGTFVKTDLANVQ